jgi:hypothetical protein
MENKEKRWVPGFRTNMWFLVDDTDKNYENGLTQEEFFRITNDLGYEDVIKEYNTPNHK